MRHVGQVSIRSNEHISAIVMAGHMSKAVIRAFILKALKYYAALSLPPFENGPFLADVEICCYLLYLRLVRATVIKCWRVSSHAWF